MFDQYEMLLCLFVSKSEIERISSRDRRMRENENKRAEIYFARIDVVLLCLSINLEQKCTFK